MASVSIAAETTKPDTSGDWTRALFEAIDDAVFVHDPAGNILEANPAACRRLGYTREEMLHLNTRDIDHPDFAAGFQDRLETQLHTGHCRCEGRHRTKDGRIIPVDINTSSVVLGGKPAVLAVMRDITQQKVTENTLARQSELLSSILDNMGDAVVVADTDKKLLLYNPAAQRLFGLGDPSQTLGKRIEQRLWYLPDKVTPFPADEAPLERSIRGEEVDEVEMYVRPLRAATGLWVSVTGRPIRDEHGTIKAGVIVCRDFTERQHVEDALRDSEALYQSLVQSLPQNIFRKDRSGRVTFANQHYCETLKRPLSQLLGKTDFDLFPAELAAKYVEDDRLVLEEGKIFETVEAHHLPQGGTIYVQVVKTPVRDAQGNIIGTQCIFWDVTERKRAVEILAESERRYRQLTEATLDGIVLIDETETIRLFNPAAERLFDYQAAEVIGLQAGILVPAPFREADGRGFFRYLQNRHTQVVGRTVEVNALRKDGTEIPVEIAVNLISFKGGLPAGGGESQFLCAFRDLTERNKMRSVLVQNEKLASIGLLSAGVAHEINNPLAFVANNLVVLERDGKGIMALLDMFESAKERLAQLDPDLAAKITALEEELDIAYTRDNLNRLIARTRDGVDRVTRIVHSLRGMARTDTPRHQEISIPDLVANSLEILQGRYKRSGIAVDQEHDANPRVTCVQTQISQVLLNLLVNAYQALEGFHKEGGRIKIRTRRLAGEMLIEVADNGPGIPAEHLDKIFDPFFTTKDVGEGTGLGLSITHNIVTAHGGRIEVDSEFGHGARFQVYLPLKNPKERS